MYNWQFWTAISFSWSKTHLSSTIIIYELQFQILFIPAPVCLMNIVKKEVVIFSCIAIMVNVTVYHQLSSIQPHTYVFTVRVTWFLIIAMATECVWHTYIYYMTIQSWQSWKLMWNICRWSGNISKSYSLSVQHLGWLHSRLGHRWQGWWGWWWVTYKCIIMFFNTGGRWCLDYAGHGANNFTLWHQNKSS